MKKFILATIVLAIMATPAMAGFTPVNSGSANEPTLLPFLQTLDNSITDAMRVDDSMDQIFRDGTTNVSFEALFWGGTPANPGSATHKFGYSIGAVDTLIFTATGGNPAIAFETGKDAPFLIGLGDIRWWADNTSKNEGIGSKAWSDSSMNNTVGNTGIFDRMVTYDVTGTSLADANGNKTYILAFDTGSDGDYNDLIVKVSGPHAVPAPGALLLGSMGVSLVGWLRRRKSL